MGDLIVYLTLHPCLPLVTFCFSIVKISWNYSKSLLRLSFWEEGSKYSSNIERKKWCLLSILIDHLLFCKQLCSKRKHFLHLHLDKNTLDLLCSIKSSITFLNNECKPSLSSFSPFDRPPMSGFNPVNHIWTATMTSLNETSIQTWFHWSITFLLLYWIPRAINYNFPLAFLNTSCCYMCTLCPLHNLCSKLSLWLQI